MSRGAGHARSDLRTCSSPSLTSSPQLRDVEEKWRSFSGDGTSRRHDGKEGKNKIEAAHVCVDGKSKVGAVQDSKSNVGAVQDSKSKVGAVQDSKSKVGAVQDSKSKVGAIQDLKNKVGAVQDKVEATHTSRKKVEAADVCKEGEETERSESSSLAAEEKALQELVRSREEELAVAQLARERMSTIFSAEEIQQMAERQRKRGSYLQELESACSPLLPAVWLGLVEERLNEWKQSHAHKITPTPRRTAAEQRQMVAESQLASTGSGKQPLSKAQLLAASRRGTGLDEVAQVVLYRSRQALDLSSLQQCPNLRTITLSKCGLDVLMGISAHHCPRLVELSAPVRTIPYTSTCACISVHKG